MLSNIREGHEFVIVQEQNPLTRIDASFTSSCLYQFPTVKFTDGSLI